MIGSISRIMALMMLLILVAGNASAYGRSTEDLVGAFSIEKSIRLGSNSECFSSGGGEDPLNYAGRSALADAPEEDRAPILAGFSIEPQVAHLGQPVNITAHVIDDESGLQASESYLRSPSGKTAKVRFDAQVLSSGGSKDGLYTAKLLPEEFGLWRLQNVTLIDNEGNTRTMQAGDLMRLGLPTELLAI